MITEVIEPDHRGQGIASKGIDFIKQKYKSKIFAEIKKSNIASIKLHKKNGFVFNVAKGENEIYCYDPKMVK
jgi:RimJ/RimL family protein N-acetyltransferase